MRRSCKVGGGDRGHPFGEGKKRYGIQNSQWVESFAYRSLEGDKAWEEHYMGEFSYEKGSGKYYQMGMLKGLLLDQTGEGWQEKFSLEEGFDGALKGVCQEE